MAFSTTMAASSQTTPTSGFRQTLTFTRPDLPQARIVEYPEPPTCFNTRQPNECPAQSQARNSTNSPNLSSRLSPRLSQGATSRLNTGTNTGVTSGVISKVTQGTANTPFNRKKKLESLNLQNPRRTTKPSPVRHGAPSSSGRRSDSATNDSQKSARTQESQEEHVNPVVGEGSEDNNMGNKNGEETEETKQLTEEEMERRRTVEKCLNWIERLPAKFSGMHIAQERAPKSHD